MPACLVKSLTSLRSVKPLILYLLILLIAAALRGQAFNVNTRAYGDVNLMSVAAKQYILTSPVQYPWSSSRFPHTLPDKLATPAYMHGAAYPFIGGVTAKILSITDTFFALKLIDFLAGMVLVAVTIIFCQRYISLSAAWIAGLWVATSPVLIDFSANGSPYILGALALSLLSALYGRFQFNRPPHYALTAIVCAVGFQVHPSMLVLTFITLGLGVVNIRRLSIKGVALFGVVWFACYLPSFVWYVHNFGRPFVSQQIFYITSELGITQAERTLIQENPRLLLSMPYFEYYLRVLFNRSQVFLNNLAFEVSLPMLLFSAGTGIALLFTRYRQLILLIFIPRLGYFGMTAAGLALLHMRFLVPVIPALLILAAIGIAHFTNHRPALRRLAAVIAVAYAAWAVYSYFSADEPTTRYYRDESAINERVDAHVDIGRQLIGIPEGTIVGCDDLAIVAYITDQKVIEFACPVTIVKLERRLESTELNIRYALVAKADLAAVQAFFDGARIVAENEILIVYELPR
jgi:hypothetical protein